MNTPSTPPTLEILREMEKEVALDLQHHRVAIGELLPRYDWIQSEIRKRGGYDTNASLNRTVQNQS